MTKTKFSHKVIAVFLTINFLQSFIPYNMLLANNNGPNAPEAAAFEPVDATDMVNLLTGDFTYVLPLLNVPSPEGGYPIALSYHAGIAMEQEASWVGLGWSLNPGAINRNVNGFPDDWGKTNVEEFFYDAGWEEDYYNFSIGATLYNSVSVGLGFAWGSNKSLSGSVSIGYDPKGTGLEGGISIGFNGGNSGVYGGYKSFSGSVSTSGVGVGYAKGTGSGEAIGIGINYSYNSGLSAGASFNDGNTNSVGINFSSNGASVYGSIAKQSAGVYTSNHSATASDYDIIMNGFQATIPLYYINIGFGHQRVKYSLFRRNHLMVSGMAYPFMANETKSDNLSSRLLLENHFMDVNVFPKYSNKNFNLDLLMENNYDLDKNNLVLPNYDTYAVTAQGLSGTITPMLFNESNLSGRGRVDEVGDGVATAYVNKSYSDSPYDSSLYYHTSNTNLGSETNFHFKNVYNSFLRIEKTNIANRNNISSASSDQGVLESFTTINTSNYNSFSGEFQSIANHRKREGNFIEVFTNKKIRQGTINGFTDSGKIDRSDTETFLDEGIGGYRITTIDGKTYHYSLPVYNYEVFYKNFQIDNDVIDENKNFFEFKKTKPYATHWLLTAITGPDYVDMNNNGLDKNDYGYWVEFDYGKWSDGYGWRGPTNDYEITENEKTGIDTYSYYWGRKQIYYLDAIKTRSHTALFVKSLRSDSKSSTISKYAQHYPGSNFNLNYAETFTSNQGMFKKPKFAKPGDVFYKSDGSTQTLPQQIQYGGSGGTWDNVDYYVANKSTSKYVYVPRNHSLKLDKIIVIKSDVPYSKNTGNLVENSTGYIHINDGFSNIVGCRIQGCGNANLPDLYNHPVEITPFEINLHQNVLDIEDIDQNIENEASQIIEFDYSYSLARNTYNSFASWGQRLTLDHVIFNGKKGVKRVSPPYSFKYHNPSTSYNKDDVDDWGYHKTTPEAWNLSEIQTPTGGKIKVSYESDSYYAEAAYNEESTLNAASYNIQLSNNEISGIQINIDTNKNINDIFEVNRLINVSLEQELYRKLGSNYYIQGNQPTNSYNTVFRITSLNNLTKSITAEAVNETFTLEDILYGLNIANAYTSYYLGDFTQTNCYYYSKTYFSETSQYRRCFTGLKVKTNQDVYYADNSNKNGKKGGGLRVKSITVNDGTKDIVTSEYGYRNPDTDLISGITSYAPSKKPKGVPYISELPAPMVTYEYVTMINKDGNDVKLGETRYHFETLSPFSEDENHLYSLGKHFVVDEQQDQSFLNETVQANKYTIYDKLSHLGRPLSVIVRNSKNQVLSKTINNYKENLDANNEIGVLQESYKSVKKVQTEDFDKKYLVSSTSRINYPSAIESVTTSQALFTSTTYFDKHDFLTGKLLETRTFNSNGLSVKSEIVPAYKHYLNMGAKVDSQSYSNMLSQETANYTFMKDNSEWKITNVGISTWNKEWDNITDVWRKHKTFIWNGTVDEDGLYVGYNKNTDDGFNWSNNNINDHGNWKKISEVTRYNNFSTPLETKDINNNLSSVKYDSKHEKIMAVSNAPYDGMFYSGAEDLDTYTNTFGGNVNLGSGASLNGVAHTGNYSLIITSGEQAFMVTPVVPNDYKVSVWVHKTNYEDAKLKVGTMNISHKTDEVVTAGDWKQLNFYSSVSSGQNVSITSSSGQIRIDDFRMHPVSSGMTSYVYNQWDELEYIIDTNNMATKYEYDEAGKLKFIYAEKSSGGFIKIKEYDQYYKL